MPVKATRGRPRRRQQPAGPAFVVPPTMTRRQRRDVQDIIKHHVEVARREAGPRKPFRFRFQLAPLAWLAVWPDAWALRHERAWVLLAVACILIPAVAVSASRHRSGFTRGHVQWWGAWSAMWLAGLAAGWPKWCAAVWLAGWLIPYWSWLGKYRWRPDPPPAEPEATPVEDTWRALAGQQKWAASIGQGRDIAGGRQWPIQCLGTHTHITQIAGKRDSVAAAYSRPVTEAYVEPDPHGIKDKGTLTILAAGTLDEPREHQGNAIEADGLGTVARFPDGTPVRQRWWVPGVGGGARHTIVAGCDGSGKTGFLDLDLVMSCRSGLIAPIILDPQMGQALPAWRDKVPYACGPDECLTWLRGLHAGLFDRSQYLAQLEWTDAKGRRRKGMGFFDAITTGLPFIEIVIDEAPILLALKGAPELVLDIGKLGRKAGFRLLLAAQVPSLAELKAQALRSMLVGGNVFCFRTGDKVTSGMVNIPADPEQLPKYFRNGKPTVGLGYADTIDNRQWTNMRTDWLPDPYEAADQASPRELDPVVRQALDTAISQAQHQAEAEGAAMAGEADAQLQVLAALAHAMSLGELISTCTGLTVSQVVTASDQLQQLGRVHKSGDLLEVVRA